MSGFTGLVLTEGHFVIKKMCGFRNIQIRVDGALMFNATLYMSEIQHQGCGLTAPGRLRRLTFSFGRLKKSSRSPGRALLLLVQCSVKRAEKFNILVFAY